MNKIADTRASRPHTRPATLRFAAAALILVLAAWAVRAPSAAAATITVTTTADENNTDGDCSLREAVLSANGDRSVDACEEGDGADTIILPAGNYVFDSALGTPGEDLAATGDLDILKDLTIIGAGRALSVIDAGGFDRVFQVTFNAHVTISGVTITGGNAQEDDGGGILVISGSLALTNSRVTGNATGSIGTENGGGIYYLADNSTLNVTLSRIDNNIATGTGGGIYVEGDSSLSLLGSRVDTNIAGGSGGIKTYGPATIRNSLISGNVATFSVSGTGGIGSSGPLIIVNSTISGNSTIGSGGGLVVGSGSTADLYNVTITGNTANSEGDFSGSGGGITIAFGTVNFQNTLIAGNIDNSPSGSNPDCSNSFNGTFNSLDYNLIQDISGCTITGQTGNNLIGVDPLLGILKDNGGQSPTHLLKEGSPAIDAGDSSGCEDENGDPLTIDQRGFIRPVNGDAATDVVCDIGAYETLSPGAPTPTPTTTPTNTSTPTQTLTATATTTNTATPTATTPVEVSSTPTATYTITPGPSPTPTATSTDGPSPTPTATTTEGPSPTPTATETPGPSPTPFNATDWLYIPISLNN